jgi:hypothetical protein
MTNPQKIRFCLVEIRDAPSCLCHSGAADKKKKKKKMETGFPPPSVPVPTQIPLPSLSSAKVRKSLKEDTRLR